MKNLIALLVALTALSFGAFTATAQNTPAAAPETPPAESRAFVCTPEDFSLTETPAGLLLTGRMEVPTPGYGYRVSVTDDKTETLVADLILTAPLIDATLTVIDRVEVQHLFTTPNARTVNLHVRKNFEWGISTITCTEQLKAAAPETTNEEAQTQ